MNTFSVKLQIAGPKAVLQQHYFDTASNKDILIRILDNLKKIFWEKKSWAESKSCIERQPLQVTWIQPKQVDRSPGPPMSRRNPDGKMSGNAPANASELWSLGSVSALQSGWSGWPPAAEAQSDGRRK